MITSKTTVRLFLPCLVLGLLLRSTTGAEAAPIPVFQFTLEYWENDAYEVEVLHDGAMTVEQRAAADRLEEAAKGNGRHANVALKWRNYAEAVTRAPADLELPRLRVSYPGVSGIRQPFWEVPLEEDAVEELLHSPKRQRIADELLRRSAGVWLFLKSGNENKDRMAREFLEKKLAKLETQLTVPEADEGDWGEIVSEINFSLLTLRRDDPDERVLVQMLLNSEPDLNEYENEPILFPIYGRGRIMHALVGDGINRDTVTGAGRFLTAPCTVCQSEGGNRGVDMLMSVNWNESVIRLSNYPDPGSFN